MCDISGSIYTNDIGTRITNYETSAGRNTSGGFALLSPTSTQLQKIKRKVHTLWLSVVNVFSGFSGPVSFLVLASKTYTYRVSCTSVVKGGNIVFLSLAHKRQEVIFVNLILGLTSYFTENTTCGLILYLKENKVFIF